MGAALRVTAIDETEPSTRVFPSFSLTDSPVIGSAGPSSFGFLTEVPAADNFPHGFL